jgi:dipeptidyl aminopeptidase/acylaminoacyl peptidase
MPAITPAMLAAGRELSEPRLTPDGTAAVAVVGWHGRAALVRFDLDGGPETLLTSEPAPRSGRPFGGGQWAWVPDGSALVLVSGGDLWLQPVDGSPARRLTAQPAGSPASAPAVSAAGRIAYVVDQHHVELRSLDDDPATAGVVLPHGEFAFDPAWSPDGRTLAWHEWSTPAMPWDRSEIVVADATTISIAARHGGPGIATQQPRFAADGRLGWLDDRSGWLVLHTLDPGTGATEAVLDEHREHGTAAWGPGQRSWCWSPDGTAVAFCRNEDGHGRLCVADVATAAVTELGRGWHGGLDWRGTTLVAVRSGARTPTQLVAYDGRDRRVLARGPVAGFDAAGLVEPELVAWAADDGTTIPGRLYRPAGGGDGRLLLWVHGGPTGQWPVEWNARVAFWVARGWSVLLADHRGSTGWGRRFQQALDGRWGIDDADDVAAGARAAVARGWGRAGAIVGMGGSAGGFTVLNVAVRHPGLLAAAVVAYPVVDLTTLAAGTHRFEAHSIDRLVGPADGRHHARSPLTGAGTLALPLLVFHGTADEVVPFRQSEALVAAVSAAGGRATLVAYDGEGHGWSRPALTADELERTDAFLSTVV